MNEDFSSWLNALLDEKGWSRSEAARRGGISASMFDKVISGNAQPGLDFLRGIARAFGLSLEQVMRKAGILPAFTELPDGAKTWGGRLTELSDDLRPLAVAAMEAALRAVESAAQSSRR
jgi:transcriptional regulator with XRE-family HTH domain